MCACQDDVLESQLQDWKGHHAIWESPTSSLLEDFKGEKFTLHHHHHGLWPLSTTQPPYRSANMTSSYRSSTTSTTTVSTTSTAPHRHGTVDGTETPAPTWVSSQMGVCLLRDKSKEAPHFFIYRANSRIPFPYVGLFQQENCHMALTQKLKTRFFLQRYFSQKEKDDPFTLPLSTGACTR